MEPFSILCETCAARLKVRNASLINQVLACPKCQGMVKVLPPEGWVPPPELQDSLEGNSQTSSSFEGSDFDDIDSLIKKEQKTPTRKPTPTPTPQSPNQSQPASQEKSQTKTQANSQTATAQSHDTPILPGEAWTSEATRKRQRLTLILASALAGLILLIGIVIAVVANSKGSETVAQQEEKSVADLLHEANSKTLESKEPDNDSTNTPAEELIPETEDPPKQTDTGTVSPPEPATTQPLGAAGSATSTQPPEIDNPHPLVPKSATPEEENTEEKNQQEFDPLDLNLGPNTLTDDLLGDLSFKTDSIASQIGDLNDLLSTNGVTLGEINNIAEANRVTELVGVPKYFVKAPDPQTSNLTQNLSNQLGGIQYQNGVTLTDFNRDIGDFLGSPISVHVETLLAIDVPLDPLLDMKTTDVSFQQAIESAISPLGLTFVQTERGLVIVAKGWNTPIEKRFKARTLSDDTPEGQASLVRLVRNMFAEKAWENGNIKMEGGELVVTQLPQAHFQIQRLLKKLNACEQLKTNPADAAALETLQTEWSRAQKALTTSLTFQPGVDLNINSFLRKVESLFEPTAEIRILVDWNSLSGRGWAPSTLIPGEFSEDNLEDTLREFSRSLGVTFRALDENTFEILTFEEASQRVELQVYPAADIITEEFRAEELLRTLQVTLAVNFSLIQVRMDPTTQAVIVIAPQSIHRQVEAVIEQLRPKSRAGK